MKKNKALIISNMFSLFLIVLFLFLAEYSRPPVGDDVLSQFKNGISYYLDNEECVVGPQCSSVLDAAQIAMDTYFLWGGRLLGFFLGAFRSLIGDVFISVFTSLIYTGVILFSCRIVRKSWKEVFAHPFDYVFLFFVTLYLSIGIDFLLMWTMITIYSVSVLLILIYGTIQDKFYQTNENRLSIIFLYNLLGLVAGITQEIYVALICVFMLVQFIINKERRFQIFKYNIGFVFGALICFFAPGNYNRGLQSHENALKLSYMRRLISNIYIHIRNLAGVKFICVLFMMAIAVFLAIKLIKNRKLQINNILYYWFGLLVFSVFAWAIVATPNSYSTYFFVVFSWIVLLQLFVDNCEVYNSLSLIKSGTLSALFMLSVTLFNFGWLSSNLKTRLVWNYSIKEAVYNNKESIKVPKFEEKYSNRFNMHNYNNDGEYFKQDFYLKYYQTLVVPN